MKIRTFLFAICITLFSLANVEAGGWGTTKKTSEFDGFKWEQVYFNMDNLHFEALLPNYSGTVMQNGAINMYGSTGTDIGYVVITSMSGGFEPPKKESEFKKIIQDANPDYTVTLVDTKKAGIKFAADLKPKKKGATDFWRTLCTKDRLIHMGSADSNETRRVYFFDSLNIK